MALIEKAMPLGGGAGLNFSIVGGTTQPASPKENTIWINTNVEVDNYYFTNTEPINPSLGDVWFKYGTAGNCVFNVLKNSIMEINISHCQQWNGNSWEYKEVKLYKNAEWIDMADRIYDNGTKYYNGDLAISGNVKENTTNIVVSAGNGSSSFFNFPCAVDLSPYSTIKFTYSKSGSPNIRPFITTNSGEYQAIPNINGATSIDVSSFSGEYYIGLHNATVSGYSGSATLTQVYFE